MPLAFAAAAVSQCSALRAVACSIVVTNAPGLSARAARRVLRSSGPSSGRMRRSRIMAGATPCRSSGRSPTLADDATPFPLGEAAPDAVLLPHAQRMLEARRLTRAAATDLLGFRGFVVLRG